MNLQDENGKTISFSPNTSIRLPPNLFIFATMNTSDQNVFLLDNAFQRRFELKMVSEKLSDPLQFNFYQLFIGLKNASQKFDTYRI